ncbi:malonyl-CoA synthase [marine gamma proteobacterium HTCC2143]|uniref:Malonyl-CoA synthase n=1 Tax=marine gamma proteobacterium HTCC2143 TaxID=247633 RepID=A0YB26_9GAMM|nr:malonyl-CoA synthase [marine gamma proteobacterium HTCC2143]
MFGGLIENMAFLTSLFTRIFFDNTEATKEHADQLCSSAAVE